MLKGANIFLIALEIAQAIIIATISLLPPPPITVAQQEYATEEKAADKSKQSSPVERLWNWTTNDAVAFYTLVLCFFTGTLAISTIGLYQGTKDAAVSARIAAEHIPRVERAYLFLSIELKHKQTANAIPDTGDIVEVQFAFKNHGKTPAILTKIEAEVRTVTTLPTELRERAIEMPPGLVIGSGETTPYFPARNLIVPDDLARIRRRERTILFVGAVEYLDIFGKPHKTGFCLDRDPVGSGFGPSPTTILNYYT
jgi:hypothetical protein